MFYQKILNERHQLKNQLIQIQQKIASLPEGTLICSNSGKYSKWYITDGHQKIYLSQKQRTKAEQLALKKYLSLKEEILSKELTALDFYLRHHPTSADKADALLSNHSPYRELLIPYFKPISEELSEWANAQFPSNPHRPEQLIHKTDSGILVRSKSEAMIVHFLYTHQIPFRYECALTLGASTIFPDFTIRHPKTGQFYYHEHFGRMDDPSYAQRAASKLQLYIANGIIPSIQLLTTYENPSYPLSFDKISALFTEYFL